MSSFAPFQQSAWSLTSPFTKREFQFTHHTARSRAVTKSLLEPVLALGVKWALKQGATNVPVPTYGELVVTLFDSSEGAPDEDNALGILAAVLASTKYDGKACIGDALRSIVLQRSPQSQRVRREASLLAERGNEAVMNELFSPAVRQPSFSSTSQPVGAALSPEPSSDHLAARLAKLELNAETLFQRLTSAVAPAVPTPCAVPPASSQGKIKKAKAVVAPTPVVVPVPVVGPSLAHLTPSVDESSESETARACSTIFRRMPWPWSVCPRPSPP